MASSSSSSNIRRYHDFHGPDVRRGFLSQLHNLFARKGITTFKDQQMERGHTIGPELVLAIRESRVSIVVRSKNYSSSSWCLDELVEILMCREDQGQIVMTLIPPMCGNRVETLEAHSRKLVKGKLRKRSRDGAKL